jgi:hypothetical protein
MIERRTQLLVLAVRTGVRLPVDLPDEGYEGSDVLA